ncbi:hypothetical protein DAEQUDRAFT_721619 [Daedalea quercina L-15889]|uniref:F-box domain-containing protein n=1 Tax=Daedalea quercina L-15889 TaxID=1314783 RepID=A0A165TK35_9APHY|nr:hypothetical protein DAEQUDRAFT_721619 [Daedalea quercina L-15889]
MQNKVVSRAPIYDSNLSDARGNEKDEAPLSKKLRTSRDPGEALQAPFRSPQLPAELWSLIFTNVEDRHTIHSASLVCRVAHREADAFLYRDIIFKRWRNRYIATVHRALKASPRRQNMVRRLAIRSANGHIEEQAVTMLVEILLMVPNLIMLELAVFKPANLAILDPLLGQLASVCPFRLLVFLTDAPFETDIVGFYAQQQELIFLSWDIMHTTTRPPPAIPPTALNNLRFLRCETGIRPFVQSARSITHLEIGHLLQWQINQILELLSDQLVSFKIAERRNAQYTPLSPALVFRHGIPRGLKYLELREVDEFQSAPRPPKFTTLDSSDVLPFSEPGLSLETFVWQAMWMCPSDFRHPEIRCFAEDVSEACHSLRDFVFFSDKDEPMSYKLLEGELVGNKEPVEFPHDMYTWCKV